MKAQDPKGYYRLLRVPPDAPAEAIKRAFRTLAMDYHPDKNPRPDAEAQFRKLSEAYAVLSDDDARAFYDRPAQAKATARAARKAHEAARPRARAQAGNPRAARAAPPPDPAAGTPAGELVKCSACQRPTAQPRRQVYWTVAAALVTWRRPTEGIYCAACAGKTALRCSAVSAALGWWGLTGFVWTPLIIWRNARGGARQEAVDAGLLWHNAKAFLLQGKLAVAHALARQVAAMKSSHALDAADLLAELHRAGVPRDTPPLVDPWRPRVSSFALQGALGLATPVMAATAIAVAGPPTSASTVQRYASAIVGGPVAASTPVRAGEVFRAVTPVRLATCAMPPVAGQLLEGRFGAGKLGHYMEITNGAEGPAIVKARDPLTDRVRFAVYVGPGAHARIGPLSDGAYRIQYAIGPALAEDCRSLTSIDHASEFPETETLSKDVRDGGIVTQTLAYTLYAVPDGNVRPQTIPAGRFLSD